MTTATYPFRTQSAPGADPGGGQTSSTSDPTAILRRAQHTEALRLRRHASRQHLAILGVATLLGVWLGVAAPGISPVAPSALPPAATIPGDDPGADPAGIPIAPVATAGGPR